MSNDLSALYPVMPKLALAALREHSRFPAIVNSRYSGESSRPGQTVHIPVPKPAVSYDITAGTLGTSTNIAPKDVILTKSLWRGTNFVLSDLERSQIEGGHIPSLITEHVRVLANYIDNQIIAAAKSGIGNIYGTTNTPDGFDDVYNTALKMNNTLCPDEPRYFGITPTVHAKFSGVGVFTNADVRGNGGSPLINGSLGKTHGFEFFMDQNLNGVSNTSGTVGTNATGSNNEVVVNGALAAGVESMVVDGAGLATGTIKKGQKFTFAGLSQEYSVQADVTLASNAGTITFEPFLQSAIADNTTVTFLKTYTVDGIALHPDCIALVYQDFEPIQQGLGVLVYDEVDPISGAKFRFKVSHANNQTVHELQVAFAVGVVRPEYGALLVTYSGTGTAPA